MSRRFDLVCFDLVGTLVSGTRHIWVTLHEGLGTDSARRARARADYFAGRLTYRQWFDHDIELMREVGATREAIRDTLSSLYVTPGAVETLGALRGAGCRLAIVSGAVDLVFEHFLGDQAMDAVHVNRLRFDARGRLIGGEPTPFDIEGKAAGLAHLAERFAVSPERIAFVGDHDNDVAAAGIAGLSLAFNPDSEALIAAVDVVVREPSLAAVIPHLLR